jgi:hypothetical protein
MHRIAALAEVCVAAAVVVGHNVYGVVPNEVLVLLVIGALSLAIRRQSLRSIGFRRPSSWTRAFLIALAAAAALQLLSTYVTEPLISRFTGHPSDLSQFRDLVGDVGVALVWLAIVWTFAAFGEEFVYRGYVLNRIAESAGARVAACSYRVGGAVRDWPLLSGADGDSRHRDLRARVRQPLCVVGTKSVVANSRPRSLGYDCNRGDLRWMDTGLNVGKSSSMISRAWSA